MMTSAVRRTEACRKSSTGQSRAASGSRATFRRCSQAPSGINRRPRTNSAGTATKTTSPAYGLSNIPASTAITSAMNATADAVVITAPATASGWRRKGARSVTSLLQARHVGDERVEIGCRQAGVLRRHRRLLGRIGFRRRLFRVRNPLLDVVVAQLAADAVQRIGLVALAADGVAHLALLRGVDL